MKDVEDVRADVTFGESDTLSVPELRARYSAALDVIRTERRYLDEYRKAAMDLEWKNAELRRTVEKKQVLIDHLMTKAARGEA